MHVLMHLDPKEPSRLIGLWVASDDDGGLAAFYPPCSPELIQSASWTLAEKVAGVGWSSYFRQLAGRVPTDIWWETTEIDEVPQLDALFVDLSAAVLASAAAWHGATSDTDPDAELQFTVKMFSEDEADRLGIGKVTPMKPLDKSILARHAVAVSTDNPFQQRARLLQALWREKKELPIGTRNNKPDGEPLGSRLEVGAAKSDLGNYLSDTIKARVRRDVEGPDHDRDALFGKPRIYCDLLSSQPLCFNLFAELDADRNLATEVFGALLPGVVERVTSIRFEHSPGRGSDKYLGNRSAFDVFVEHTTPGGKGFIGIEVKYHENLKVPKATMEGKPYGAVAEKAGCFDPASLSLLGEPPLQQLWLDHLLALSMLQADEDWKCGRFVVLAPALNDNVNKALASYRSCLTDESTFSSWTLEQVHQEIAQRSDASWVRALGHRYLDFDQVESSS